MILLIDIGNSRVKWAMLHGNELMPGSQFEYLHAEFPPACFDDIAQRPDEIHIASVGGELIDRLVIELCHKLWDKTPHILRSESHSGAVSNGYEHPSVLGVDRWAAMIGAYKLIGGALLLIDCGTACSADVVDRDGKHLGGAIIPGLQMMQNSLREGTARIESTGDAAKSYDLGVTTEDCIQFGVKETILGFIERMERIAVSRCGERVAVILTGGSAVDLLPHLSRDIRFEKELVFIGMACMVAEAGGSLSQ